jgi:hypothetical protein
MTEIKGTRRYGDDNENRKRTQYNRTLWRTRSGRGYGRVVRQSKE